MVEIEQIVFEKKKLILKNYSFDLYQNWQAFSLYIYLIYVLIWWISVSNSRNSLNIEVLTNYVTSLLGVKNVGMYIPVKLLFGWTDFDAFFVVEVLDIMRVTLLIFNFKNFINYVTGGHITKKNEKMLILKNYSFDLY